MREGKVKFKGVGFTRPCSSISTRTFEHGGCPQTSKSSFYLSDSSFLFFRFYNEQLISFFLSLEQKYTLISSAENKTIVSEQILVVMLAL